MPPPKFMNIGVLRVLKAFQIWNSNEQDLYKRPKQAQAGPMTFPSMSLTNTTELHQTTNKIIDDNYFCQQSECSSSIVFLYIV